MSDVARTLVLPDLVPVSDQLLKTLVLYWDEVILVNYSERLLALDEEGENPESQRNASPTLEKLRDAGLVSIVERRVSLPEVPAEAPVLFPSRSESDPRLRRILHVLEPLSGLFESIEETKRLPSFEEARPMLDAYTDRAAEIATDLYLQRMHDAYLVAVAGHLGPTAPSGLAQLASVFGPEDTSIPRSEAALLSVAMNAFEVDPDVSVEDVITFREKNARLIGRLRGSLTDTASALRGQGDPSALLSEAADAYSNRVVPALGDLENVLAEGKVGFTIKALLGVTALTVGTASVGPATVAGATLAGDAIKYRLDRDRLVDEHPYGYLHRVSADLAGKHSKVLHPPSGAVMSDPRALIKEAFKSDLPGLWNAMLHERDFYEFGAALEADTS